MNEKKKTMKLILNSLERDSKDFTLVKAKFIIMDDNISGNKQQVDRNAIDEGKSTLKDKPIVAKYFKTTNYENQNDHFGDHEEYLAKDRYGNDMIDTDTIPIGHFISEGYWDTYKDNEVLSADAVLYAEKYPNEIDLLEEWLDKDIQINTSCEYLYKNYTVQDGIEHIHKPIIFTAHAILNSELRDYKESIDGAYSDSQLLSINMKQSWNQARLSDIKALSQKRKDMSDLKKAEDSKNKKEEVLENNNSTELEKSSKSQNTDKQDVEKDLEGGDNKTTKNEKTKKTSKKIKEEKSSNKIMDKVMNQLSHDDIRWKLYSGMTELLTAKEYFDMYIIDVYDKYFVVSIWEDEDTRNIYAYDYKKDNNKDTVEIDANSKREVEYVVKSKWVEVKNQLKENTDIIANLNSKLTELKKEKENLEDSLNNANKEIERLGLFEKQANEAKIEKQVNSKIEEYKEVFSKISNSALKKFETEEVQLLIRKSINDDKSEIELNKVIIDCIKENATNKSINSKKDNDKFISEEKGANVKTLNNLISDEDEQELSFEEKYMENY